jgi:hypothetical protein
MKSFSESVQVVGFGNAEFFAANLFYESFAIAFPVSRDNCGLSITTPADKWPICSILQVVGYRNRTSRVLGARTRLSERTANSGPFRS